MDKKTRLFLGGLMFVLSAAAVLPSARAGTDAEFFSELNGFQALAIDQDTIPFDNTWNNQNPGQIPAASTQPLAQVGNDNNNSPEEFALDLDASGAILGLSIQSLSNPAQQNYYPLDGALKSCGVQGADRLDDGNHCGIELVHAIFSVSAVRLLAADVDSAAGGTLTIIYLKHYSFFGSKQEREMTLRLKKSGRAWEIRVDDPGPRGQEPVDGLFLHRAKRGIAAIIPCLNAACPAQWSQRPYGQNDNLPPIYEGAALLAGL